MQNPILIKKMSNENRGKKDRKNVRRLALMEASVTGWHDIQ